MIWKNQTTEYGDWESNLSTTPVLGLCESFVRCFVAVPKQCLLRLALAVTVNTPQIHLEIDELVLAALQLMAFRLLFIPPRPEALTDRRLTT